MHLCRIAVLVTLGVLAATPVLAQDVLYVDDDAPLGGDGLSWGTAFRYLQDALHVAEIDYNIDEVHVAGGIYYPDEGDYVYDNLRDQSFELLASRVVRGGYAGLADPQNPDERDFTLYESTLSGDLMQNDSSDFPSCADPLRADNSFHVLTADNPWSFTSDLDGFHITGGNANGSLFEEQIGGGVRAETRCDFWDCSFSRNSALDGGGAAYGDIMAFWDCSFVDNAAEEWGAGAVFCTPVVFDGCIFVHNKAPYGLGGAIYSGSVTLTDCVFQDNTSARGGAIDVGVGEMTATDCVFENNSAIGDASFYGDGGAIYSDGDAVLTLSGCRFSENTAEGTGGAIFCVGGGASPFDELANCQFFGNDAGGDGGAIWNLGVIRWLRACEFAGNTAAGNGGALLTQEYRTDLINCTLTGNSAEDGGAVYYYYGEVTLLNCTVFGNSATDAGGGLYGWDHGEVDNSIVWGNSAGQDPQMSADAQVTYSCVEGGWSGDGNISVDPQLVDPDGPDDIIGTEDDDVHLLPGSLCINAADPDYAPEPDETDFEGDPRVLFTRLDMGADEATTITDCDGNAIPDWQDIAECDGSPGCDDCNGNGVPDGCELQRELAARWRLDESSGTTAEEEVSGFDGTLVNYAVDDPSWTTGVAGNALTFDGVDDHVTHDFNLGTRGTLNHWLYPGQIRSMAGYYESDGTGSQYNGFGHSTAVREIHSGMNSSGAWYFLYQDGMPPSTVSGGTATVGVWTHVAITWDTEGDLVLYVDGDEVDRVSLASSAFDNGVPTYRALGRVGSGQSNRHWDGLMDDVQVYDRVLSPDEITHLADGPGFAYGPGVNEDCNGNGVLDECDIAEGTSEDCNANGVLDECDLGDWPVAKFLAAVGQSGDNLGGSVALSADIAVVGADKDAELGSNAGAAYVFRRSGDTWVREAKLLAADGESGDYFGQSVALSGDVVVVGAYGGNDFGVFSGAAYLFRYEGGVWIQEDKLLADDGDSVDRFGISVAVAGDVVVVGASDDEDAGYEAGSAYVFRYEGGVWTQETKLLADDGDDGDLFGSSVATSGDIAVIGSPGNGDLGSMFGAAYVFRYTGTAWVQEEKLLADDAGNADRFGCGAAISGETIVLGAWADDDGGDDAGAAYVFRKVGSVWSQEDKLVADDGSAGDHFGHHVAVDGDMAVVGANTDDELGHWSGSAYVFYNTGTVWVQEKKLLAPDGAADARFGNGVAVAAGRALVGAPGDDDNGEDAGAAYLYNPPLPDCNGNEVPDECDITSGASSDCNTNDVPDDCELAGNDCNSDGVPDDCQLTDMVHEYLLDDGTSELHPTADHLGQHALLNHFTVTAGAEEIVALRIRWDQISEGDPFTAYVWSDPNGDGDPADAQVLSSRESTIFSGWSFTDTLIPPIYVGPEGTSFFVGVIVYRDDGGLLTAYDTDNSGTDSWLTSAVAPNTVDPNDLGGGAIPLVRMSDTASPGAYMIRALTHSNDCNENEIPDDCELAASDCNGNLYPDDCDIAAGVSEDCNYNAIPDECDIATGIEQDCNTNGIPDSCELLGHDCNTNGIPDECDIATGASADCNTNDIPDECDVVQGQSIELLATDPASGDELGASVAVSGNVAVVGASLDDDLGDGSGSAYVFRLEAGTWVQEAKLTASDGTDYDYFGSSVAVSGDVAVSGAPYAEGTGVGRGVAYVFRSDGSTWVEEARLIASDGADNDSLGNSVAVAGDVAVVGARLDDDLGNNSGSAYVFRYDGDTWEQEAKLTASDGEEDDSFGVSVAVSGNVAVVGASKDDDLGNNSGAAYVFRHSGGIWVEEEKLLLPGGDAYDGFGEAVAISGDIILVGASGVSGSRGAAYVFRYSGGIWVQEDEFLADDGASYDRLGYSVGICGDVAIVGAWLDDDLGQESGSAYVFHGDGGVWVQEAKLTAPNGASYDRFGQAVAISGGTKVVGAYHHDGGVGDDSGAAYAFVELDCDGNGVPDDCQTDSDGDGVIDDCDGCPNDPNKADPGICGCGIPDTDSDGDGIPDCEDNCLAAYNPGQEDCDDDGVGDACAPEPDCNENGVPDSCDITGGTSADANGNGIPDECEGPIRYVDDDGPAGGYGTSWYSPYRDLQDALSAAAADANITEIRVADGIYVPSVRSDPAVERSETFRMLDGVVLLGGYRGCPGGDCGGGDPDERDLVAYESVLSGDPLGDDDTGGSNAENTYHVVYAVGVDEAALLDGFTITAGNADHPNENPYRRGSGLYMTSSAATIHDCTFRANNAERSGGGVYTANGTPLVDRCTFLQNTSGTGGGLYNSSGNSVLQDCTFNVNAATTNGGGVYVNTGDVTLTDCTFEANTASSYGGGGYLWNGNPQLVGCRFLGNTANSGGGGLMERYDAATLVNCLFNDNNSNLGGGFYQGEGGAQLINCTLTYNTATSAGGGVYNSIGAPVLTNCLLWGNTAPVQPQVRGSATITYSCIEGGGFTGAGNIEDDPLFTGDEWHLASASPCVNAGDDAAVPVEITTDFEGDERIQQCRVDMGVDETDSIGFDCNTNGVADACDLEDETSIDCNGNWIPDECDTMEGGDFDADGDVDLDDYAALADCLAGPNEIPSPSATECVDACLAAFDANADNDVDLTDFAVFQLEFTGTAP